MRITRMRMLGGAAVLGTAAVVLPAAAAVAFNSPPLVLEAEAQSPAHLVAGGAAVDVSVETSCTAKAGGMYTSVRLTEAVGKKVATGQAATTVPCDGATHTVVVRVPASGNVAFAKGQAAASTYVDGCTIVNNRYICGSDTINRTIKIKK
jgi:hypothetical protein